MSTTFLTKLTRTGKYVFLFLRCFLLFIYLWLHLISLIWLIYPTGLAQPTTSCFSNLSTLPCIHNTFMQEHGQPKFTLSQSPSHHMSDPMSTASSSSSEACACLCQMQAGAIPGVFLWLHGQFGHIFWVYNSAVVVFSHYCHCDQKILHQEAKELVFCQLCLHQICWLEWI